MDRLDALRAFTLAVDRGSLSAAGRQLARSPASITRAIAALEDRLGAPLLVRTTRALKLTEAGERFLPTARRVLDELDVAEAAATATAGREPHGQLTVTAPVLFGSLHVRPLVESYLASHAGVRVRLLLLDRVVNLVDEGVDIAVRIAHLPDSALIATAVGAVRRLAVASPAYLARHGTPRKPADLAAHRCISSLGLTPSETWTFRRGRAIQVRVAPVLSVNHAESAIGAAAAGAGITCALSYQVADHLERGALVRLLPAFEPPPVPVQLVFPAAGARAAKVRAFLELATPRLRAALARPRGSR
ncbi:MAG: LysR family transcriptional regulator [Myxococcales bacterium]|nr:LysR family transcriptional regulator [Myxococcales bacterium]